MDSDRINHRIAQWQKGIKSRQERIAQLKSEIIGLLIIELERQIDPTTPSNKVLIDRKREEINKLSDGISDRKNKISSLKAKGLNNLLDELAESVTPLDRTLQAINEENRYRNVILPLTHKHRKQEIWLNHSVIPTGEEIDRKTKKLAKKVFSIMNHAVREILEGTKKLGINIPRDLERHLTIFHCFRPEKKDRVRISMLANGSLELHISSTDRVSGTYQRVLSKSSDLAHILTKSQLELIAQNPEIIFYIIEEDCIGFTRFYQQIKVRPPFTLNLP